MYTKIKTFEDACLVLELDAKNVIPDFSFFPKNDIQPMIDHAKLVIINQAINGKDYIPDWSNSNEIKYYPWFIMGSSSGVGFAFGAYDSWLSHSHVGSRLCFKTREKALYAGKQFEDLYKSYFVK